MSIQYLKREGLNDLAYVHTQGDENHPAIVFLGGYKSDMQGTKATHLEHFCISQGLEYLRLDYSGHGASGGQFVDGTIGQWADDASAVISHVIGGKRPIILIGSSMGGWIAMILTGRGMFNVTALIGIAAAPDFTRDMFNHRLNDEQRAAIMQNGRVEIPNDYSDEPYILTKALFDDGQEHFVLDGRVTIKTPMHLLQGKMDKDVPWQWAENTAAHFGHDTVKITYIDDGNHSLSRPEDLEILERAVMDFVQNEK